MTEWMKFIRVLHCNLLSSETFTKNFLVQNCSVSNISNAYASLDCHPEGWLLFVKPYTNYLKNSCQQENHSNRELSPGQLLWNLFRISWIAYAVHSESILTTALLSVVVPLLQSYFWTLQSERWHRVIQYSYS